MTGTDDRDEEATECLSGPVEDIGGNLVLRIPLDEGGARFLPLARGWGYVEGDCLELPIQSWMAEKLGLKPGGRAVVGIKRGKLTVWSGD